MANYCHSEMFKVVVVEQADTGPFNRGALLNVGYQLSAHEAKWLIFHDVDLLPVSPDCDYSRPCGFSHVSNRIEQYGFTLPYRNYVGGVLACTAQAFATVNGFSNKYAGWGCEDDDLFVRSVIAKIPIERRPGVFRSLRHARPSSVDANHSRLGNIVKTSFSGLHLGLSEIDARLFLQVDPAVFRINEQGIAQMQSDGLNTLRFAVVSRSSLKDRFPSLTVDSMHEIVTVTVSSEVD